MEYKKAAESYLTFCRSSGMSVSTVENYERTIREFGDLVSSTDEIGAMPVVIFKQKIHDRGCTASTEAAYIENLSLFFDFLAETGTIEKNPCTASIRRVKVPPKQGYENLLTTAEVEALLSPVCPKGATKKNWLRDHAMITVLLTSGLRNSELRDLRPDDLDFKKGQLFVRYGKGGKSRYAAFPKVAQDAVKSYVAFSRPDGVSPAAPLFGVGETAETFHAFDRRCLSELIARIVKMTTGREGVRTHALRHANASYLLSSGVSIDVLQTLLGHSSPQTTKVYAEFLTRTAPTDAAAAVFDTVFAAS